MLNRYLSLPRRKGNHDVVDEGITDNKLLQHVICAVLPQHAVHYPELLGDRGL